MQRSESEVTRILVTGANGFIGNAVSQRLLKEDLDIIGATRRPDNRPWVTHAPPLEPLSDWRSALLGRSVVIHTAGRAHVMNDQIRDPVGLFRMINTTGTLELAEQAAITGVRRFIFLSSIGVNGTRSTRPFNETDVPRPIAAYAVSKLEAERGLMELAGRTGMEVVIIRPPLVYGPNAPGNFGRLVDAIQRKVPLPLGAVTKNRRTLVGLDNLVDLIMTCTHHPAAGNQVFLAGDDEDLSTTELLRRMARALGVASCLLPVPEGILKFAARAVGKGAMIDRLCGSLQVDITKAREVLGWAPPFSVDEGLARAVNQSRADLEA